MDAVRPWRALRMDDVGAASKRYEVYSKRRWGVGPLAVSGNWLFLKYLPSFKAWGPYRELRADEWRRICDLLERRGAKLTVGITAAWVESEHSLIPFPEQCPAEARAIKEGVDAGIFEVANHGLTHCVVEGGAFRPRAFSSNRQFHREFWDWIPAETHEAHIRAAQEILQRFFGVPVVTFVPPGNVFADVTLTLAARYGLRYLSCATAPASGAPLSFVGDGDVVPFHDRDLVLHGLDWLEQRIDREGSVQFCFVRELAERASYLADRKFSRQEAE
jgi:peptidoglycan/xylan/chitin deacetylase (PgdA/CDA1 family)